VTRSEAKALTISAQFGKRGRFGKVSILPYEVDAMNKEKTLYLIDGSAYIYRAYHAIQSLTNSKGLPTNAAFGFTRTLLKLIEDRAPEYVAMFFDAKGPTFRHKIYKEYKANRPPMPDDLSVQIPYAGLLSSQSFKARA
jgi:5'-3' exonuclease